MKTIRKPSCHPERRYFAKSLCKACYEKRWRLEHPSRKLVQRVYLNEFRKKHPESTRNYYLNKLSKTLSFGLLDYNKMFDLQKGVCAICNFPAKKSKRLCIDHDHVTGKVRGLLCQRCNYTLGMIEGGWLPNALKYLDGSEKEGR